MKQTLFAIAAATLLLAAAGCACKSHQGLFGSCSKAPETCESCAPGGSCAQPCRGCGGQGCGLCRGRNAGQAGQAVAPGPASGAITYPYYTTRGPRDFLARNPESIGP